MAKARISVSGWDEMVVQLENLGAAGNEIAKRAVYVGAGILADAIKENLEKVIDPEGESTGALVASLGIAKIKTELGVAHTSIGFDGYDSKGVPNALKARAMESGTSKQKKKPFIRPALNAVKSKVETAMVEEAERLIAEKIK